MWKYKALLKDIVICSFLSAVYAAIFPSSMRIETIYLDVYLTILWVVIYAVTFMKKESLELELHRFSDTKQYLFFCFKEMSKWNLMICLSRYLGSFMIALLYQSPFRIIILHYTIHWFIVFEIFIVFNLAFLRNKHYQLIVYVELLIITMMFFFGLASDSTSASILFQLNPFVIYFFPSFALHYLVILVYGSYFLLGYLLLVRKRRRLE